MSPTSCQLLYPAMYRSMRCRGTRSIAFCECKDKGKFSNLPNKIATFPFSQPLSTAVQPFTNRPHERVFSVSPHSSARQRKNGGRQTDGWAVGRPAGRQAFRPADRRIQRIRLATISARSHTSVVVPRTSAFLHSGRGRDDRIGARGRQFAGHRRGDAHLIAVRNDRIGHRRPAAERIFARMRRFEQRADRLDHAARFVVDAAAAPPVRRGRDRHSSPRRVPASAGRRTAARGYTANDG